MEAQMGAQASLPAYAPTQMIYSAPSRKRKWKRKWERRHPCLLTPHTAKPLRASKRLSR